MKKTGFAALAVSLVLLFAVAAAVYGRLSGRYAPPPVPVPPAVKNTEAPPGAAASRRGTQAPDTTGLPAQTSGTSAAGTDAQPPVPQETTAAAPPETTPKNTAPPEKTTPGKTSPETAPPVTTPPPATVPPGTVAPETAPPETEDPNKNTVPDFPVLDADGNTVRLSDMFGKPVVINFWATWCPPWKRELPDFDRLCREYGDRVVFMMVNLTDGRRDTVDGTKKFVSEKGYTFPVYFDTGLSGAKAYSVSSTPQTTFIDANGNVFATRIGAMSEAALRSYINAILGG